MPTSIGESARASPSGASDDVKTVHGQLAGVLKLEMKLAAIGLPAESLTPPAPLTTVTVYVRPLTSAEGVRVAVRVAASYATVAETAAPRSLVTLSVVALTVEAVSGSLKVTFGFVVSGTS